MLQELDKVLFELSTYCDTFYINTNEHYRANVETETREDRFTKKLFAKYPAHSVAKSNPILQRLRSVKDQIELDLMQHLIKLNRQLYIADCFLYNVKHWHYFLMQ